MEAVVRYGFTFSYSSFTISSSSAAKGARSSPAPQQPPLHLFKSQTNCLSITLSLTSILSIAIKRYYLNKNNLFAWLTGIAGILFPFQRINKMLQILFQKIVYDA